MVPARRARVACTACPADAQAGQPVELTFEVDRPVRIRRSTRSARSTRPAGASSGTRSVVTHLHPESRGVLDTAVVQVASSAPFGLVWWARDIEVPLPRLLHVAPRTGEHDRPLASTADAHGESVGPGARRGWVSRGASVPTRRATPVAPSTGRPPPMPAP